MLIVEGSLRYDGTLADLIGLACRTRELSVTLPRGPSDALLGAFAAAAVGLRLGLPWQAYARLILLLPSVALLEFAISLNIGIATFGFSLLTVSPSFWATAGKTFPLIFRLFWGFKAYPTRLFPSAVQFLLTWIFPVAVAVFIPSQVLFGQISWAVAIKTVGIVAALELSAGLVRFGRGLRRYQGVGH